MLSRDQSLESIMGIMSSSSNHRREGKYFMIISYYSKHEFPVITIGVVVALAKSWESIILIQLVDELIVAANIIAQLRSITIRTVPGSKLNPVYLAFSLKYAACLINWAIAVITFR